MAMTIPADKKCKCTNAEDYGYGDDWQNWGAFLGHRGGAWLGGKAKGLYGAIFGSGDYTIRTNSLIAGGGATDDLTIVPKGPGGIRVMYREYLGDVFTHPTVAGAFNITSYPINPGLMQTFPWLCTIAQGYEQYIPNGIVFEFKSTSSEYVATQALGSVIMATEYDPSDAPFANKGDMLNAAYTNEAKPSQRILHGVECDPRQNPNRIFYVRSGYVASLLSNSDLKDYDIGLFQIATQGGATANLNLGSLYVHYDITFLKEQIYNGIPNKGPLNFFSSMTGVASVTPLGTQTPTQIGGNFTPSIVLNTITFPTWSVNVVWEIKWYFRTDTQIAVTFPSLTLTGGTTRQLFWGCDDGATTATVYLTYRLLQTAKTCTFQFGNAGLLPGGTVAAAWLGVSQVNDNLLSMYV